VATVVAVAVKQSGTGLQLVQDLYVGSRKGHHQPSKIDSFIHETPFDFFVQSLGPPLLLMQGGKSNPFSHAVRWFDLLWQSGTLI